MFSIFVQGDSCCWEKAVCWSDRYGFLTFQKERAINIALNWQHNSVYVFFPVMLFNAPKATATHRCAKTDTDRGPGGEAKGSDGDDDRSLPMLLRGACRDSFWPYWEVICGDTALFDAGTTRWRLDIQNQIVLFLSISVGLHTSAGGCSDKLETKSVFSVF